MADNEEDIGSSEADEDNLVEDTVDYKDEEIENEVKEVELVKKNLDLKVINNLKLTKRVTKDLYEENRKRTSFFNANRANAESKEMKNQTYVMVINHYI